MMVRQQRILNLLLEHISISNIQLALDLDVGARTVFRDLSKLIELGYVQKIGQGKNTTYAITLLGKLHTILDDRFYEDKRLEKDIISTFNFDIFDQLKSINIFEESEIEILEGYKQKYINKIKIIDSIIFKREIERLIIDFSWKSSQIEGNTYSLLETEELLTNNNIINNRHSKQESTMILNHKKAFEYIRSNKQKFQQLSKQVIYEIHSLLIADLDISKGIRRSGVGISSSNYRPIDNQFQIEQSLEQLCELINYIKNPFAKSLLIGLLISYIQPFNDGNKRCSRLLSNAILYAFDYPLLSFRSLNVEEYRNAVIGFYEYNSISHYKELYIRQIKYFSENYL